MAGVHKVKSSPYWRAAFKDHTGCWITRSTYLTDREKALEKATQWEIRAKAGSTYFPRTKPTSKRRRFERVQILQSNPTVHMLLGENCDEPVTWMVSKFIQAKCCSEFATQIEAVFKYTPTPPTPKIYFLCWKGIVQYIGQSIGPSRMHEPRGFPVDAIYYLDNVPRDHLDKIELWFIATFNPPFNKAGRTA